MCMYVYVYNVYIICMYIMCMCNVCLIIQIHHEDVAEGAWDHVALLQVHHDLRTGVPQRNAPQVVDGVRLLLTLHVNKLFEK